MNTEERSDDMQRLVEGVNGFVYPGDRCDAVVQTVEWLRLNPEIASRLLAAEGWGQ